MSWFSTIFGGGLAAPIEAVGKIVDSVYTSDGEMLDKQAVMARIAQQPALVQAEINKVEAQHRSVFVAGWRPYIGWVCGTALVWHFMLFDMLTWVQINYFPQTTELPTLSGTEQLMTVLMALLGLGAMRTAEKFGGKAK